MVSDPNFVYGPSIIKRNRAERKVLGIKRTPSPNRPEESSLLPPAAPEPKEEPKADILQEVLDDIPPMKLKPIKEVTKKKSTKKKSTTKKKAARGKNKKVEELNQDELSDLFTGGSNIPSDDDDE